MFKVYQIKISKEISDFVNSNDHGHTGGENKYPIYEARMRLQHGVKDVSIFKDTDFGYYTPVCSVKKDAGLVCDGESWLLDHLEDVFKVLNGYYYDEDTEEDVVFDNHVSDYKMKTITRKDGEVVTYRDMHSLSVGDIVEDVDNGSFHIVASFGFLDITDKVKNYVETVMEVA